VLRAWNGRGAVRVFRSLAAGDTSALLLEACEPGTPLERVLPPREQDAVVAGLLCRLWTGPPAGPPFRPLAGMCERWAGEFEHRHAAARARGRDELDPGIARAGIDLFRLLPATARRQVLLCTDLHPGNVLAATREPWLVIDPKPYAGDPAYDPLQHMLNFPGRVAGLLGLDAGRLRSGCSPAACRSRSAYRTCAPPRSSSRPDTPASAAGSYHHRTAARRRSRASTGANTTQPTWSSRRSSQFGAARTSHPA